MTTMKDKLSASVRQAKAGTEQEKPVAAKPVAAKPVAVDKPAAVAVPKVVAPKPSAANMPTKAGGKVYAGDIPESNATLHPQRVWPD